MNNTHPCSKCLKHKPVSDFQLYKNKPSGQCRQCKTESEIARRRRNGIKPKRFSYITDSQKLCLVCNKLKPLESFSPAVRGVGGVGCFCKPCFANRYRDKAKARKATALYRKRHRESWLASHRLNQYKRRSKIQAVNDGSVNDDVLIKIYSSKKCLYCKKYIAQNKRTLDHLTPLARGGHHTASNVGMACVSCNSAKGKMTFDEFKRKQTNNGDHSCG